MISKKWLVLNTTIRSYIEENSSLNYVPDTSLAEVCVTTKAIHIFSEIVVPSVCTPNLNGHQIQPA